MIRWRSGVVRSVGTSWPGAIELQVHLEGEGDVRALAYEPVVGRPEVGDRVLLNTTAVSMDLGTGGYAMVVALPERLPADPLPGPGHRLFPTAPAVSMALAPGVHALVGALPKHPPPAPLPGPAHLVKPRYTP